MTDEVSGSQIILVPEHCRTSAEDIFSLFLEQLLRVGQSYPSIEVTDALQYSDMLLINYLMCHFIINKHNFQVLRSFFYSLMLGQGLPYFVYHNTLLPSPVILCVAG